MAGRKRERYKIEPRISVPFMLELEYESKIIKKLLVIKEICTWLPPGLDGRKVFIVPTHEKMAKRSLNWWLVTHRHGLPAHREQPILILTRSDVE